MPPLLRLGAWTIALVGLAAYAAEPVGLTARVDSARTIPLRPGIFSIAGDATLGGHGPQDDVPLRVLRAVRPPFLRLPAGDSMNLWDWNEGTYCSAEKLRQFGEDSDTVQVRRALRNRQTYAAAMGGPMTGDRWAAFAAEGGSEPVWGLNVTTAAPADTRKFLEFLKARGLPAGHFELGNELYLPKVWHRQIPTVAAYIEKARAHAAEVKAVFPQAKVSVCIPSPMVQSVLATQQSKAGPAWDAALARDPFFDAVVVHAYAMSGDLGDLAQVTADQYERWAMVRSSPAMLGRAYEWVGRIFPHREIWITEWNLNQNIYDRAHAAEGARFRPEHTMLSGLFVANFLLQTAAIPSNVTMANIWQICGEDQFGLISGNPARERPSFQVFRLLSPAIHDCDRIAAVELPGSPMIHGPGKFSAIEAPEITAFGLYQGNRLRYLTLINFTEQDVTVAAGLSGQGKADTLTAPALLPGWDHPANGPLAAWAPPYDLRSATVDLAAIPLAARAFSVVKVGG